ncbi:MAZ protein, partial [Anthoscopus minutus]|nr:MAZ protein [Anthoscopus minutus]
MTSSSSTTTVTSPAPPPPVTSPAPPTARKPKGAPYLCSLCSKEFKNGYNLRRHQATHGPAPKRGPRPPGAFPPIPEQLSEKAEGACPCPEGAGPKGRKSHACETCGKGFRDVYHLKRHRLSHTDERPFQCPVCQQRFK